MGPIGPDVMDVGVYGYQEHSESDEGEFSLRVMSPVFSSQ